MGSRVKDMEQLFILEELPEKKIYPNQKALEEIERLWKVYLNSNPTPWDKEATIGVTKISFLNTQSMINKFDNDKYVNLFFFSFSYEFSFFFLSNINKWGLSCVKLSKAGVLPCFCFKCFLSSFNNTTCNI